MQSNNETRRGFIQGLAMKFALWSPVLSLMGLRFCAYGPRMPHWRGWIEWCGRCVGFVARDGRITWMSQLR